MAKPTIVTRAGKGSALTWTEGDANLTNLRDATITVSDGTNSKALNLNDTLTFTAGTNITLSVNTSTGAVTINSTASGGATTLDGLTDVVITAAASGDILRFDGTNWVDVAESSITVGTATVGSTVTLTADNSTNATNYPLFVNAATGNLSPRTDTGFTYNPSTGVLSAVTFNGALNGNASSATSATNINISTTTGNSSDTTLYPVLVGNAATGDQASHIHSTNLSYSAATGYLTATRFVGSAAGLTGTFAGSVSTTGIILANNNAGAKLQIGSGANSLAAWTTTGAGLSVLSATYTDTSSLAGTVGASHVHAIAAPTMASTNAITVTDAGTLYISGAPTAGTNTTITNGWAILAGGPIKATNASFTGTLSVGSTVSGSGFTNLFASPPAIGSTAANSGAFTTLSASGSITGPIGNGGTQNSGQFTTLSASSTVSGTGFSTYLASPPAIGGTTANTGAFTTLSATTTGTSGVLNLTYNPATASGAAIQATGKDSQGGTGYFDFLKATNTTTGVTNGNKTIRLTSTGAFEIINSAYSSTIFSLTDAGTLSLSGGLTAGGTTFPTSTGTTGQVLTLSSAGTAAWSTPSSGGNNTIILDISQGYITFGATANTNMNESWTLTSSGGVSGVSVSTNTFTLPSGTYNIRFPTSNTVSASKSNFHLRNTTDSTTVVDFSYENFTLGGVSSAFYGSPQKTFTIAASKTFTLRTTSAVTGGWSLFSGPSSGSNGYSIVIIKTA